LKGVTQLIKKRGLQNDYMMRAMVRRELAGPPTTGERSGARSLIV
jgi:hypothetical protein